MPIYLHNANETSKNAFTGPIGKVAEEVRDPSEMHEKVKLIICSVFLAAEIEVLFE